MARRRRWRGALSGSGLALLTLPVMVAALRLALAHVPLDILQFFVGTLLLFGMRWLRKAILRGAGIIPPEDEAAYARQEQALRQLSGVTRTWDEVALATAFKITMIEGIEVVLAPASAGARRRMACAA